MEVTSASVLNSLIVGVLLLFGLYFLSWIFRRSPKNVPPGPREWGTNWKILKASWNGTLPKLASEWALKYKDITFVYSFGLQLVFLNSAEITRKLLTSNKYKFLVADRSPNAAARIIELNGKDLVFSKFDGKFNIKRRLFYSVIGLYGDGVAKFEDMVWREIERMFMEIDVREGKDTDLSSILTRSLKIILYILVRGEGPIDPKEPEILEEYDMAVNKLAQADVDFVLDNLPFLTQIPGKFKRAVTHVKEAKKQADELLFYGPKRTHKPGEPRGITDLLLDFARQPGYEWMKTDEQHIIAFLTSLVVAGNLTTRSSLTGIFLCLVNYPEVIRTIQGEIDNVIGSERPKLEHRSKMPYTEATILEGLRLISPVPLNAFRRASEDIDFEGMVIPKNALILINSWHFLHDENKWEDPWAFNPKRFLDDQGNLLPIDHPRRKDLIAFGVGARACPGEMFSRSRMFLFITSILQRYDLLPPANESLTSADFNIHSENVLGLVRQTPPFKCRLVRRQRH
ncbi:unnamed protein product [Candidula unifasciata]|uniref:Cytochrome P450 n=1 Tax=Candidula unifasciata TaxID=100452 RepID=A0A8S3ZFN1_9EUPU|nr:unnamed protein product [Candidula unifasciata]